MTPQKLYELLGGKPLTDREIDILFGAAKGETCAETATRLILGTETVRQYRKEACAKLEAKNITNAVAIAIGQGLVNVMRIIGDD